MALGKRLDEAMKFRQVNQTQLAELSNTGTATIQIAISRDSKKSSYAGAWARALRISLEWLTDGTGSMLDDPADPGYSREDEPAARGVSEKSDRYGLTISIPQYDTGGKMGDGGLVLQDQPGIIQGWSVSREWVQANVPNCTSPANLCIVTGFGDSMIGVFNPGDPVLVDRGVTACDHDGLYFFRVGNEGFIKRLQRIPGAGILVISQNPNYRDWTLTESMDFEVFGKVLKAWKGENY